MGPQPPSNDPWSVLLPGQRPGSTLPPGAPPMAPTNPWGNDPFPRTSGDRETLAYHTPTFRKVAAQLRTDLENYKKAAERLAETGQLQPSDLGQWAAGQDLYATAAQTHQSVSTVLEAFVAAYQDLIHKLEQSAGTYDSAEDKSVVEIRKLLGLVGDGGNPATQASPPEHPFQ
jgi:hypothetical protein